MMINPREKRTPGLLLHVLYLVFFASLIFSFRSVSSISIALILLAGIFTNPAAFTTLFQNRARNLFLAGCALLFLVQLIALLYTRNMQEGLDNVRIKTGLLIIPLAVSLSANMNKNVRRKMFFHYCVILIAATLYCFFISFLNFRETNNVSVFFYHALAKPLNQHAVYFSILVITGLIFLLESLFKKEWLFLPLFHICTVIYLSLFLFLLASKFAIAFYLFYLAYYFIKLLQKNKMNRLAVTGVVVLCITATGLIVITRNPVRERFNDIIKGDIKIIMQDRFDQGDYFNGLQFRLLQWRFVAEILTENKRWWQGVSPGDAQYMLNAKYISKNMYTGDPAKGSRGYLIYNTHNQFLETLLQTGIFGLAALLLICYSLVKMVLQKKSTLASFVVLLLLTWLFSESVFETQYGIIIFTFFPLFIDGNQQAQRIEKPTF